MNLNDLKTAAAQHFYWFNQAAKALGEMNALAFDMSEEAVKNFADARTRFELARAKCKVEFDLLKREVDGETDLKPDTGYNGPSEFEEPEL
jgi:hypothetical protein